MTAHDYWEQQYAVEATHHQTQNQQIAESFLHVTCHGHDSVFRWTLSNSDRIVEVGCGTGELAHLIERNFHPKHYLGTDLSARAVQLAQAEWGSETLSFQVLDFMWDKLPKGDLVICSNVLEHFRSPFAAIARLLQIAPKALLIVPHRQGRLDHYETEGGAGHAYTFSLDSFTGYRVYDWMTFKSDGWSCATSPFQLAVLIGLAETPE